MAVDIIIDPLTGQIYWNDSQTTAQSIAISGNGSDLIKVVGYSLGYTAAPSGTITTGAATTAVTGSGTAFTTQLAQGAILYTAQGTSIGTVSTITNDTSLSLTTNASGSYTAISFRITPSTGTDRLVFSDSATPIYPATTGANLGTSSYRWSLYASAGDFTNTSTTTPNLVIDKSGISSTESTGLQLINTSLATSGGQYQFPSWLEFKGKVWNTTVTAASNDARMRLGMAVNSGTSPQTEFVLASSIDTGTASWYYPLTINSTANDSIVYFNNSVVSIGKLLTNGTTSSYALELYNYNLATSGQTVNYSPGFEMNGSGWNTSTATSNIVRFRSEVQPTTGASVAGTLIWKSAVATSYSATPSFTDRFKIASDGTVTIPGSLTLGSASGALYASTGAVSVGTLPVSSGGTGSTTATSAINTLLPTQTGNGGKYLTTDGTSASWGNVGGSGTVSTGTDGKIAYYAGTGTVVDDATALDYSTATTTSHLTITAQAVGNTPLLLKASGAGAQTGDLLKIQSSTASALVTVDAAGIFTIANSTNAGATTSGALKVTGGIGVQGTSYLATTNISALAISGDITSATASLNVLNANVTTLNIGGGATTLALGSSTGTTTINNTTVAFTNATTFTGTSGTITFLGSATTVTAFGSASSLTLGTTSGTGTIRNATVDFPNATTISGSTGLATVFSAANPASLAVFGAATTATAFGSASSLTLGATSGTGTIRNATVDFPNATTISGSTGLATVFSSANPASLAVFGAATTATIFGSAATLTLGATSGTGTIRNATIDFPNATTISGSTGLATVFSAANPASLAVFGAATTATIFGSGTALTLGTTSGTTTIRNTTVAFTNATNITGTTGTVALFAEATTVTEFAAVTSGTVFGTTSTATFNFATGALTSGQTKTINIGTNGVATSTTAITIGNTSNTTNSTISFAGNRLQNVGEPTQPQDAATKYYVDSFQQGLDLHESVRAVSATAIGTSVLYFQQNAPSSTSGTAIGTSYIESVNNETLSTTYFDSLSTALSVGQRVLVALGASTTTYNINGVTTAPTGGTNVINGIYSVTSTGGAGSKWRLDRATDTNDNIELQGGTFTFVQEGSTYADSGWVCTNNTVTTAISIGSDAISFTQFSGAGQITAGAGLTKTGNTIDIGAGTGITVNTDTIQISATYAGQTSINTLGTITTGTWNGTTIAIGNGGTGTSSLTTSNAIVYYDGSNSKLATLGTGATTTVLVGGGASAPSFAQVDLTTMVTGTLPLTRGGLGTTTFTQNGVLYGNLGTSILVTAAGTNGQLFLGVTSGAPQWGTMSGDASIGNTGVITINNSAVTYAKIQSSVSGNTVLGRSAATGGAFAEIAASSDGSILRLNGTALGFGSINLASSNAVGSSILPIGNGGTGSTTAANAINALLPTQTGNGGKYLTTDGTSASWGTVGGSGTVSGGTASQLAYYSGATTTASAAAMVYSAATNTTHLTITAQAVGNNPLKLVGTTSQTADLFTVATSGGTVFNISSSGVINSGTWNGTTIAVGYGGTGTSSFATNTILTSGATTTGAVTTATALAYSASNQHLTITAQGAATSPLRLVGTTAQTADLFQIYSTSSGTLLGSVGAFGGATFTSLATSATTPATALVVTGAAHTALNTATEYSDVYFNLGQTKTFTSGAIATLRTVRVAPATYAFSGASTVTNAATFQIDGAPTAGTNATLTEAAALRILTGTASGKGLVIRGSSSQTGNYIDVQNNSGTSLVTLGTTNINLGPHGASAGNTFELRFSELAASGSEYIAFKAPDAITTSYTYVWPNGAPSSGQLLSASAPSTTGVVTLSWATDQLGTSGGGITSLNSATGASQSFSNDTNVTITTNTGTNTHALGWSGSLAIGRGGIGTTSLTTSNGLVYFDNANSKLATLGTGATTTVLVGGGASAPSFAQVDLTTMVTGTLPLSKGGLGTTTFTQYGVIYGNLATSVLVTAAGTNGQLFLGVTSGAPQWGTMSGDASIGNTGVITIANSAVTYAKIQNSVSGNTVLGRSAATGGAFAEIAASSDGSVLRLSGTTLGFGSINLATTNAVTGTLPLGNGGLGTTTFTQYGVLYGNAATSVLVTAAGSTDQVLKSGNGTGAPSWGAISLGSSNAVSGILGLTNGGTATSSFATTNGLIYYTGSALATLAATVSGVLVTNGSGVPSVSTDIPTGVTIGGGSIYRAGGTDVALADGGTGQSTYTNGDILYYNSTSSTTALTKLGIAATSGYFLTSTGSAPQWSQTLGLTNGGTGLTAAGTGNYILGMNSGGSALEYKQLINGSNVTITHGAGTITIAATGGTSSALPGGSDTHVQYNSGGTAFGGTSYFAYDYTNALLTLTASSSIQTTSTPALSLSNTSSASTSVPNHYSPALDFAGKYWSAGNTYYARFREELQTTAATPTYAMVWKSSGTTSTTPSFTNRMALDATKGLGLYAYSGAGAGTNASFFKAGAQTSDFNYTLPTTAPSTSQILSVSAVSGSDITLAWANDATGGGGGGTVSSGTASQLAYYSGVTTTASAPALVYSATGTHLTITAQGASTSPLKVVGAASQSASIFTVSTSGGDVLTVDSSGYTSITGLSDTGVTFQNSTTTTKKFKFDAASITAGNTRTITIPDATTTMVGTDATQTLTNKTISGFVVNTSASVSAAGTTQGTATAITADYVVVTSATAGTATGVILPTAVAGREVMIVNRSSTPIKVYPATGASIDGAAANAATDIGVNQFHLFAASSSTSWYMLAPHRPLYLTFCAGYTPATTGADSVVLRIPDSSSDGSTVLNYTVRELFARVETPSAGTSTIQVEYYTGTSAFSATNLMSTALSVTGASTYEFSSTAFSTTTLTSGTKLRLNFTALNTTHANFYVQLLLEEA